MSRKTDIQVFVDKIADSRKYRHTGIPRQTIEQLQALEASLRERDEKLSALLADKTALDEELKRLRAEVAEAKTTSAAQPEAPRKCRDQPGDRRALLLDALYPVHRRGIRAGPPRQDYSPRSLIAASREDIRSWATGRIGKRLARRFGCHGSLAARGSDR